MSIISSLFNVLKAIIKKIFKLVAKLVKKLAPLLLVVAAVYFGAPYIANFLTGIGAPTWMSSAVANFPVWVDGLLASAGSVIASTAGAAWDSFKAADFATQLLVAAGVGLALAPEETTELLGEVGETLGGAIGSVAGGLLKSAPGLLLLGLGAFLLFRSEGARASKDTEPDASAKGQPLVPGYTPQPQV